MFFAGLPADISEYIQASSRVGRTHVGFCVLIPTPQRRRELMSRWALAWAIGPAAMMVEGQPFRIDLEIRRLERRDKFR